MVKPSLHWVAYCLLSQATDMSFSPHHLFNFLQDKLIQHFNNLSISRWADPSDLSRADPSTAKKVCVSSIFLIFVRWLQWLDFNLSIQLLSCWLSLDSSYNSSLLFLLFHDGGSDKWQGVCALPFLGCLPFNVVDVMVFGPLWFIGEKILLE